MSPFKQVEWKEDTPLIQTLGTGYWTNQICLRLFER